MFHFLTFFWVFRALLIASWRILCLISCRFCRGVKLGLGFFALFALADSLEAALEGSALLTGFLAGAFSVFFGAAAAAGAAAFFVFSAKTQINKTHNVTTYHHHYYYPYHTFAHSNSQNPQKFLKFTTTKTTLIKIITNCLPSFLGGMMILNWL